jgi:hypothetical protein
MIKNMLKKVFGAASLRLKSADARVSFKVRKRGRPQNDCSYFE